MTTLATDSMIHGDAATLGASWTNIDAGWSIVSNEAKANATGIIASSKYNAVAFPNDQWSQMTIGTIRETTTDTGAGPGIRFTTGGDLIFLQCNSLETKIYERVTSVYTQLGVDGVGVAVGDVMYLEIQGTTIVAKKNGVTIMTRTASGGVGAGSAGLWVSASVVQPTAVTWSGGDFLVVATANYILMGQACL